MCTYLNFLSPFQNLASKVRLDKVDPFYFYHPRCRLGAIPNDETRLRMNAQEVEEWLKQRKDGADSKGEEDKSPNFHTECWYLTLQAHHLSVLPCIRRYQRRLRALRELQKMVEELERTQVKWRNSIA